MPRRIRRVGLLQGVHHRSKLVFFCGKLLFCCVELVTERVAQLQRVPEFLARHVTFASGIVGQNSLTFEFVSKLGELLPVLHWRLDHGVRGRHLLRLRLRRL